MKEQNRLRIWVGRVPVKVGRLSSFLQRFKAVRALFAAAYGIWTKRRRLLMVLAFAWLGIGVLIWRASESSRSKHATVVPPPQPTNTAPTSTTIQAPPADLPVQDTSVAEPEKEKDEIEEE